MSFYFTSFMYFVSSFAVFCSNYFFYIFFLKQSFYGLLNLGLTCTAPIYLECLLVVMTVDVLIWHYIVLIGLYLFRSEHPRNGSTATKILHRRRRLLLQALRQPGQGENGQQTATRHTRFGSGCKKLHPRHLRALPGAAPQ